ncbi:DNA starvation/stationary phase protection protein [Candidatus Woesearchaeota archaeon]|nr:DNA starvation/stationary phase protection protein [Candidatus Woesearchaeota archaeon]
MTKELSIFLADNYALYIKLHNYHYNVTGPQFFPIHEGLEKAYTELTTAIDDVAERIRQLGSKVDVTLKNIDSLKTISDPDCNKSAGDMVKDVIESLKSMVKSAKEIESKASDSGDIATSDLMTQRISIMEKNIWLLESSL